MDYKDIERLVEDDESQTVEFKETTGQKREAARTLSAMLNGQGGSVLFGVTPDRRVTGQQVGRRTLEDVTEVCRETIFPAYPPSIERVALPGRVDRLVLVATVPSGNMKPFAYRGDYYIRSGSTTVPMPPETVLRMVLEGAHAFDRWETAEAQRGVEDIDEEEVRRFRDDAMAGGRGGLDSRASVADILRSMNLLDSEGRPNRGAVALFGKPASFGSEYTVLGCHLAAVDGVNLGEDIRDLQIVENNIFASLDRAVRFCEDHLYRSRRINSLLAQSDLEIPLEVIREALANAFAHRDYGVAGRIQVRVYSDRMEVVSPGGLPFGLTPADLYVPHGSRPWNPNIMACLFRRGVVEQLGSGTLRMIRVCAEAGIGRPVFTATGAEVICSVPRSGYWLAPDGGETADITADEMKVLTRLGRGPAQRGELAELVGAWGPDMWAILNKLREYGLVHVEGHGRGAYWSLGANS